MTKWIGSWSSLCFGSPLESHNKRQNLARSTLKHKLEWSSRDFVGLGKKVLVLHWHWRLGWTNNIRPPSSQGLREETFRTVLTPFCSPFNHKALSFFLFSPNLNFCFVIGCVTYVWRAGRSREIRPSRAHNTTKIMRYFIKKQNSAKIN